jgi:hypothetical protein
MTKEVRFTVEVIEAFEFREGTITYKAASIVAAMEGCHMKDIVAALRAMDHTNSPGSIPNPPRWVAHFAGLESEASGKAMKPWIRILNCGRVVPDRQTFRDLLARQV